jgi:hypothetical protein
MLLSSRLLWLLVLVDLVLIGVHVFAARVTAGHLDPAWLAVHRWRVDADGGVAESFQYLKYLGSAVLAAVLAQGRWRSAPVLAAFLVVLLLDDALRLHERHGEPLTWLVHGCTFVAYLAVARRSVDQAERRLAARLALLVAAFALFGVVLDLINESLIRSVVGSLLATGLGLVRDGGGGVLALVNVLSPPLAVVVGSVQLWSSMNSATVVTALESARSGIVGMAVLEDGGEMLVLSAVVASLWLEFRRPPAARRRGPASRERCASSSPSCSR